MKEENPFENKIVAEQWVRSVEGEQGMIRDSETYPMLRKWFDRSSKGVVADIGSGQGICSSKIEGYEKYIGIEPSSYLTQRAKELYSSPSRDFVIGNAYDLPLTNESCDTAFSVNVWFHLDNLEKASRELSRILKKGGQFFIHTADNDALEAWKGFYVNPKIEGKVIIGEVQVPVNNMSVNTFYMHSNQDIIENLEKQGLRVTKVTKMGNFGPNTIFLILEGVKI